MINSISGTQHAELETGSSFTTAHITRTQKKRTNTEAQLISVAVSHLSYVCSLFLFSILVIYGTALLKYFAPLQLYSLNTFLYLVFADESFKGNSCLCCGFA